MRFIFEKQGRSNVITYPGTSESIRLYKAKRPKMAEAFGCTWMEVDEWTVNEQAATVYADTTWGFWLYVQIGGHWYKYDTRQDLPNPFNPWS